MTMMTRHMLSLVFLAVFISSSSVVIADSSNQCVYNLYVKTGSIIKGGTDSKITATIGDASGKSVWISNLESWGIMGPKYDYFERANLDIFTGRGPCLSPPICRLNLTSDGSGHHPGWYCEYIEVTSTGPHKACSKSLFYVDQWLASDVFPFELSTVIDGCGNGKVGLGHGNGPFVVGKKPIGSASE